MSFQTFTVTDANEVRRDSNGVATCYLRGIAKMSSINDNLTALQVGMSGYQRFQPHPNSAAYGTETTLFVSEFQAVQKKHTVYWDVQVTYTDSLTSNPLNEPAVIGEIQTFTLPGATLIDYQGNAILNTAGEPPEPFDFPERIIQIPFIKNIPASPLPTWLMQFEDCVNADVVTFPDGTVCKPRTLLISSIKISAAQTQGSINFRTCTVEVLSRKTTWDVIFPSRGFNELKTVKTLVSDPATGALGWTSEKRLVPMLVKGEPPTEAQFLDLNGRWIKNPTPSQVVLLKAQLQTPVPFSQFPLS
jgi:hypothetical protein